MKEEFRLEKIKEYIGRNVVKVRSGRKCVDGRYLPTQASGMIARPGGDLGYVMALMGVNKRKNLGLTPERCFNEVYKIVSRENASFFMHTDHHADPDLVPDLIGAGGADSAHQIHKVLIGCGHVAKAAREDLSKEYDIDGKSVERLVAYARNIADIMPNVEVVNLEGGHEEAGVLVINNEQYTVNAQDPISRKMYFIYDSQRDTKFLEYLASEMAITGVDFAEMKRESDLQLQATLHNLAKGLPIYNVTFQGRTPSCSFVSFVR